MLDEKRVLLCSLRGDFQVQIQLPMDFNKADAERLKKFIDFESELSVEAPRKRRARGPNKMKPHSVIEEIQNKKREGQN